MFSWGAQHFQILLGLSISQPGGGCPICTRGQHCPLLLFAPGTHCCSFFSSLGNLDKTLLSLGPHVPFWKITEGLGFPLMCALSCQAVCHLRPPTRSLNAGLIMGTWFPVQVCPPEVLIVTRIQWLRFTLPSLWARPSLSVGVSQGAIIFTCLPLLHLHGILLALLDLIIAQVPNLQHL